MTGRSGTENLRSISLGTSGFGKAFALLKPEILVLLGDRFELLAPAISALMLNIPIAHIHGGELSEGAIDESVRHAITKMASIHFPATEVYRRRVIQMGEAPDRVFNFGAPGLDKLYSSDLMSKADLGKEIGLSFNDPVALVKLSPISLPRSAFDIRSEL